MRASPSELPEPSNPATSGGWVAFPPWLAPPDAPIEAPPAPQPPAIAPLMIVALIAIGGLAAFAIVTALVALAR